jgi:uncharacterized protein (DUF4415 family)
MTREEILKAVRATPPAQDYVWDGVDEDERPATAEEMRAGVELYRRSRGQPAGSGAKEQVAIRLDRVVLDAFRATGKGWQTRINEALKEWLKEHAA